MFASPMVTLLPGIVYVSCMVCWMAGMWALVGLCLCFFSSCFAMDNFSSMYSGESSIRSDLHF